ncbi:hypothetical protein L1049_014663 [Liquidambar formosana]|uniref:Uncharacterized protein n=1 Tax=Liquidambar formosana TaxID=63359 RepID=A0AAP0RXK2_LIQFO
MLATTLQPPWTVEVWNALGRKYIEKEDRLKLQVFYVQKLMGYTRKLYSIIHTEPIWILDFQISSSPMRNFVAVADLIAFIDLVVDAKGKSLSSSFSSPSPLSSCLHKTPSLWPI